MKTLSEKGFASIILVIAAVIALAGGIAATYYLKKASDDKKARETAQQTQKEVSNSSSDLADQTQTPASKTETKTETQTQTPPAAAPSCTLNTTMYVSVTEGHALRSEKSLTASKVVTAPYAAELKVGCKDGAWYRARYGGKEGYAYAEYLTSTKPAAVKTTSPPTVSICGQNEWTVYAAKSPTVGRYGNFANPWSGGEKSVAVGTRLTGATCAVKENGTVLEGYVLYEDAYFKYADLSTTKP